MLSRLRSLSTRPRRRSNATSSVNIRLSHDDVPPVPTVPGSYASSSGPSPLNPSSGSLPSPPPSTSDVHASPRSRPTKPLPSPTPSPAAPHKPPPFASNTRLWHDRTGHFSVEAEFLGFSGPAANKLRLHTIDGAIVEIALEELDLADLRLLEDMTGRALVGPAAYAANLPPPDPTQQKRMHQADVALKSFLAHQDDVVTKALNTAPSASDASTRSVSAPHSTMNRSQDAKGSEPRPTETADLPPEEEDFTLGWNWRPPPGDPMAPKRSQSSSRNLQARQTAKARAKTWDRHDDPGDMEILEPYQAEMIPTLPTSSSADLLDDTTGRPSTPSLRKRLSFSAAAKAVRRSTISMREDREGARPPSSFRAASSPVTKAFPSTASPSIKPVRYSPHISPMQGGSTAASGQQTSPSRKRRSNSLASPNRRRSVSNRSSPPPPLPPSPGVVPSLRPPVGEGRGRTVSASAAGLSADRRPNLGPNAAPDDGPSPTSGTSNPSPRSIGPGPMLSPARPVSAAAIDPGCLPKHAGASQAQSPLLASAGGNAMFSSNPQPQDDPVSSFFDALEAQPSPQANAIPSPRGSSAAACSESQQGMQQALGSTPALCRPGSTTLTSPLGSVAAEYTRSSRANSVGNLLDTSSGTSGTGAGMALAASSVHASHAATCMPTRPVEQGSHAAPGEDGVRRGSLNPFVGRAGSVADSRANVFPSLEPRPQGVPAVPPSPNASAYKPPFPAFLSAERASIPTAPTAPTAPTVPALASYTHLSPSPSPSPSLQVPSQVAPQATGWTNPFLQPSLTAPYTTPLASPGMQSASLGGPTPAVSLAPSLKPALGPSLGTGDGVAAPTHVGWAAGAPSSPARPVASVRTNPFPLPGGPSAGQNLFAPISVGYGTAQ